MNDLTPDKLENPRDSSTCINDKEEEFELPLQKRIRFHDK